MVYTNALKEMEETGHTERGGVVLLDKAALGPGGVILLGQLAGRQAAGQPPNDERK